QDSYPLSDAQRRIWVLSQFKESSNAYRISDNIYIDSNLDIQAITKSILAVFERHESLRTIYKEDAYGEVRQWIMSVEDSGFKIDYQDFREEQDKINAVQSYLEKIESNEFNLGTGPLFKVCIIRLAEEDYVVYYDIHHINIDGWSISVFFGDLNKYYEAYVEGKTPDMTPLKFQYKDYASWQLKMLNSGAFDSHRSFWLKYLNGKLSLLDLPSNKTRPKVLTYKGEAYKGSFIGGKSVSKLKQYSEDNGGTLFMGLFAVWNILMYRYTGTEDIIIGTPLNGREHADTIDQIGFYVNTLAIRNQVKPDDSFKTLFDTVRQNMLDAYSHQVYPFNRLVEELDLIRDPGRSAVFDIMLVFNSSDREGDGAIRENKPGKLLEVGDSTSRYDLEIGFREIDNYVEIWAVHNPDVYEKQMVEHLIGHFKLLLNKLVETPFTKISLIEYLSDAEKQELSACLTETSSDYPSAETIVDIFEAQVSCNPENTALFFEGVEVSYRELDELSNQLAHYLIDTYHIEPDDLVGIMQDRSEWLVISILGVLKSGGAYVPIDPSHPKERIDFILQDTNCKACLDADELGRFRSARQNYPLTRVSAETTADNLAYVIYTSGSTGKPKGVLIEHGNVVRLFKNDEALFDFHDRDVWTLFHSYAFDFSVWELFGALLFGGKLVLIPRIVSQDSKAYLEVLEKEKVTVLNQTPSAFYSLQKEEEKWEAGLSVRYVIFGGEALSPGKLQSWHKRYPSCKLINMYGITENTVHTTYKEISAEDISLNRSNIGSAIPTVSCVVLDEHVNLVPAGVSGELYIGGSGVARGYLNRPSLTRERFIESPLAEGSRLYRTGDKVKQLANGDLEYLGRKDDQVKIRGYRIELGEIEHALSGHEQIGQAVVLAKENEAGDRE
ncbi:MAG: amino acid adenylation domain-containing protein, partial [Cyclobacteriaceae bacterium]